ncbi:MAG: aminotransferase class IV family protein [Alphaproteobacteria bacterium]|nr:aminotransferase class IV family protein [Alphaproteobacteria bacterium]
MPVAWRDGHFVETGDLKINVADYGFARGVTVFELTRAYGGVPFRFDDHLARFMRGAEILGIPLPVPAAEIPSIVGALTAKNSYAHSCVKFYLTAGECAAAGTFGFRDASGFTPHFMMIEDGFSSRHPDAPKGGLDLYRRGIALKTVPFARQIPEVKTVLYAPGFLAARALKGTDYDEILYVSPDGFITEATISNFFCVIDGTLCTPARGMLEGVTRKVVLELAQSLGIPAAEKDLAPADLSRATEAFITGSLIEMMPVRKVDETPYKTTVDGPVYSALRKAFTACIGESGARASVHDARQIHHA